MAGWEAPEPAEAGRFMDLALGGFFSSPFRVVVAGVVSFEVYGFFASHFPLGVGSAFAFAASLIPALGDKSRVSSSDKAFTESKAMSVS